MKVDVIITTYNRVELLMKTMDSFFENTPMDMIGSIIISNDGSTDWTQQYLTGMAIGREDVHIMILPESNVRQGIIPRFNQALALCTAPYVCEFQDDVQFTAGWLDTLLNALLSSEGMHFASGVDAPEHKTFQYSASGYLIKHSSRFTQLLAKRSTWDKWFPMESIYDFPTPTERDGVCIGSKIDMNLSDGRKNWSRCKTRFLIVPGLIEHMAEDSDSTWRNDEYNAPSVGKPRGPRRTGGLQHYKVKDYWTRRGAREGDAAVGFSQRPMSEQLKILEQKEAFLRKHMPLTLDTIDYGCGVGRFSKLFAPDKYLGLDIVEQFIQSAVSRNPGYKYQILSNPMLTNVHLAEMEQFFTCNVLQHNNDKTVRALFSNLAYSRSKDFVISLYENMDDRKDTGHMRFRHPIEYRDHIEAYFEIKSFDYYTHFVHGEEHAYMLAMV